MRPFPAAGPPDSAPARPRPPDTPVGPRSWAARYGQAILRDGIAAIPNALYYYQGALALTAQEVWFTSYILAHKWDRDLPYPSLNRMAACTGVDLSWLKRLRRSLTYKGLLAVETRHDADGRQDTNAYDFAGLFAALETAIAQEAPAPNAIQGPDLAPDERPDGSTDNSFSARYGRLIARVGIAAIPRALFTHQAHLALTPQQIWFVGYILAHRWSTDLPHPSLVRMAERTGYGVRQLHNLKDSLVAQGYLQVVARRTATGGKDSSGYDFSGLLDAITQVLDAPVTTALPAPAISDAAAASVVAVAARRRGIVRLPIAAESTGPTTDPPGGGSGVQMGGGPAVHNGGGITPDVVGGSVVQMGGAHTVHTGGGPPVPMASRAESPAAGGPGVHRGGEPPVLRPGAAVAPGRGAAAAVRRGAVRADKKESVQESFYEETDSNPLSPAGGGEGPRDPIYSPYIAGVILDYSREFDDARHGPQNVSQALRLWQRSGRPEEAFVAILHEARTRTRRAQGAQGVGLITAKMAYFFRVVEDLLAAGQSAASGSR